jgi:NhaA family Na+:H+ antiporter
MFMFNKKATIPAKSEALPGRSTAIRTAAEHFVNGNPLKGPYPAGLETAIFGLGCFWGAERKFWELGDGIYTTAVGYAAGHTPNPTYEEVCSGRTGHNEVVLVVYDPKKVSFEKLLKTFWESHDPTQGMRQGNDAGTQYRSGIYTTTPAQKKAAEESKAMYATALKGKGYDAITTEILDVPEFYFAEDYHQQYLAKNPRGYCGLGGTGVSCPIGTGVAANLRSGDLQRSHEGRTRGPRLFLQARDGTQRAMSGSPIHPPASAFRKLLRHEASGGLILIASAAVAVIVANTGAAPLYTNLLKSHVFGISVLHWVNDALMAAFFLLVGLEIKRECLDGQLASWPHRILPGVAAAGGMMVPALIYVAANWSTPETLRGWAIPAATDIAFSLGVLAILGKRVPVSLKVFLTAVAILDDLGSIVIIAVFYNDALSPMMLGGAAVVFAALVALNRAGVKMLTPYLLLGLLLWFFVLRSGVHATIAGVLLAMTIPLMREKGKPDDVHSPLHRLEHALHPWVAFLVLPIFGFANAGVSLAGIGYGALMQPVTMGSLLGLFVGKQIGIFGAVWLAVKTGVARKPAGANWTQIYGLALLCGIGFTMSLFIGLLAFEASVELQDQTKVGVLVGSFLSAVVGWLVLRFAPKAAGSKPG